MRARFGSGAGAPRTELRHWALGAAGVALFLILGAGLDARADPDKKPKGRVGEEVDSICFARNINNWKAVKGEDDVVLLARSVNDWYRVELSGGCDERLFRFAHAIGIDSRPGGGCVHRGDVIIVDDTGGFDRRCFISKIYKWDETASAEDDQDDDDGDDQDKDDR